MTPQHPQPLNYLLLVKTKEPIDELTAIKVRRNVNIAVWKALDENLPFEINCIVDTSPACHDSDAVKEALGHIEEAHELLFNSMLGVDEVEVWKLKRISDLLLASKLKLRQQHQYKCGDTCKGECSGEVTGSPYCPIRSGYDLSDL